MSQDLIFDEMQDETIDIPQEFSDLPVFDYDPENPKEIDPYTVELNKKLEVIVKSGYVAPKEQSKKKSFFEKFEDDLRKASRNEPEHHGNPVIANLFDTVNHALSDYDIMHSPNFTGHAQDDRPTKVRIRHFLRGKRGLRSGVEIYAMRIGQFLDGLIRYAKYDKNFFGENNIDLKIALRDYNVLKKQIDESKDMYKRAELLHGMIVSTQILFEKQLELVTQEDVTPIVANEVGNPSDEFTEESAVW